MKSIYIETSVISYLTARPSRDLLAAAHQQVTREWWDQHRHRFEQFISPMVLEEAACGDATHVAIAAVHCMDYLITWNCRHIDNAEMKPLIRSVCAIYGYTCPEICTPEELMGGVPDER